jgi:uroporphyrinogen-III decarboxylase
MKIRTGQKGKNTMLPENWNKMTPDEKLEYRLAGWASTEGKPFATPEAAALYSERAERWIKVLKLQTPDRVPVAISVGDFLANYTNTPKGDLFYDYDKAVEATIRFYRDFDLEYSILGNFLPGPVFDKLGYKLYKWPGGALPNTHTFQFVEGEYMPVEEYDELIADPESWALHRFNPRVFSNLGGLALIPSFFGAAEMPFVPFMMAPYTAPPVQEALQTLLDAANTTLAWFGANGKIGAVSMGELGLPGTLGGFTKAPFDYLGDSLRGTRGVMMDMYRRPGKVLAAVEALVPMATQMAINGANAGNPFIFIPLHKGADGFMSNADFQKFYWPTLRQVILNLIDDGVVPCMFVEGGYNQRLDILADSGIPAGRSMWLFDQTDMANAKKKVGSWACIGGNVPGPLMKAGTPEQVERCVKELIDTCAPGGGYYISPGVVLDDATAENVHTYLRVAKEYGVY